MINENQNLAHDFANPAGILNQDLSTPIVDGNNGSSGEDSAPVGLSGGETELVDNLAQNIQPVDGTPLTDKSDLEVFAHIPFPVPLEDLPNFDPLAPKLDVFFDRDTGGVPDDGITSEVIISGFVNDLVGITSFEASFEGNDTSTAFDLQEIIGENGSFTLDQEQLALINGEPVLLDAAYDLKLTATNVLGKTVKETVSFTYDTTKPTVEADIANDTGLIQSDRHTNDPTIQGTVKDLNGLDRVLVGFAGNPVESLVDIKDLIQDDGSFTLNPDKLAEINQNTPLADGSYVLHILATDIAGNTAPTVDVGFHLNSQPPKIIAVLDRDTGRVPGDTITSELSISGFVQNFTNVDRFTGKLAGTDIELDLADLVGSNGEFALDLAKLEEINGGILADGAYTLKLRAIDTDGNVIKTPIDFIYDTTIPLVEAGLANDTGIKKRDRLTNDPTITGQIEDLNGLDSVLVDFAGNPVETFVDIKDLIQADGSFTLDADQLAEINQNTLLADGKYVLHILATDIAGNTAPTLDVGFNLDTTAPKVKIESPLNNDILIEDDRLTGTVNESLASLTYRFNDGDEIAIALQQKAFDQQLDLTGVEPGSNQLIITAIDKAGNVTEKKRIVEIGEPDTTPPIVEASLVNDSGIDNTDAVTNDPEVGGTVADESEIASLKAGLNTTDPDNLIEITDLLQANGSFALDEATLASLNNDQPLADGDYSLSLMATDGSDNASDVVDLAFTLDTTPPLVDVVMPAPESQVISGMQLTGTVNENVVSFTYRVGDGSEIAIELDEAGEFQAVLDLEGIEPGQQTITLTAKDIAGNTSSNTVEVEVVEDDGTLPMVNAGLANDTGASNSDRLTLDPTVSGQVMSNLDVASLMGRLNGGEFIDLTQALDAENMFVLSLEELDLLSGGNLPDGEYELELKVTDSVKRESEIFSLSFVLDRTEPEIEFGLAPESDTGELGDGVTSDRLVTLVGQTEPGLTVELVETQQQTTADADGNFSFTDVPLPAAGTTAFTVIAQDEAGNQGRATQDITREGINGAPTITSTPDETFDSNQSDTYSYQVIATDPDNDVLSYTLLNAPAGTAIDDNGLLTFSTDSLQPTYDFTVEASDGRGGTDTQTFTVTVEGIASNGVISGTKWNDINGDGVRSQNTNGSNSDDVLTPAEDLEIAPLYADSYEAFDLGQVPGVPASYGGLTLKIDDPNTLLIGGSANTESGLLYEIGVIRGQNNHIVGFEGEATEFAEAAFNDGGVVYGENDVLFLSRWPVNGLGQLKPGNFENDKIIDLDPFGVATSAAGLAFVPEGFNGEGDLKLVSWSGGEWYDITLIPDGNETFDIDQVVQETVLPGGPEGIAYVPPNSPQFETPSVLIAEFSDGSISSYEVNQNGDPINETRQLLLSGLDGAEGALIDPLTGDFLFSTFGGGDRVVVIQGFTAPEPVEPGLAGFTIYLDLNNNGILDDGEPRQVTVEDDPDTADIDETGQYEFNNLTPGTYTVREVQQPGFVQTSTPEAYELTIADGDEFTNIDFGNVEIDPDGGNRPPAIISSPVTEAFEGIDYRYEVRANDPDNDSLTYGLNTAPEGMTIDENGLISWTPNELGSFSVEVIVDDGQGGITTQSYEIAVGDLAADTEAPNVSLGFNSSVIEEGETLDVRALARDNSRVETLEVTLNDTPLELNPDEPEQLNSASITLDEVGVFDLVATATDIAGNSSSKTQTIRVIDPSDTEAPLIELDPSIVDPRDQVIRTPSDLIGTVTDDNLEFYRVEIAPTSLIDLDNPAELDPDYTLLAEGNSNQVDTALAAIDPSLFRNDNYYIRVYAQDFSGNIGVQGLVLGIDTPNKPGEFSQEFVDLSIPITGIPIEVTRRYSSLDANFEGDFGFGWSLGVDDAQIQESVPVGDAELNGTPSLFGASDPFMFGDRVTLNTPDGRRVGFTFEPEPRGGLLGTIWQPRFTPDPGVFETLEVEDVSLAQKDDGTFILYLFGFPYNPSEYRLTTKDGTTYSYDQFDGLETVKDRNGNTLTYNDDGIVSSTGAEIEFVRDDSDRITEIIDPEGESILYDYDANGDLVSVTDREENETILKYEDERPHYLTEIIDPLGRSGTRVEYGDDGRISRFIDADGNALDIGFGDAAEFQAIEDPLGNTTTLFYDERGNVVRQVDALGGETLSTFDDDNNVLMRTDGEGNTTTFTYDGNGNVLTETDGEGNTTTFTYNEFSQVLTTTNANGDVATNVYDDEGNLLSTTDAEENTIAYDYDDNGNLTQQTDENGNITEFGYNGFGLLTSITQELDGEESVSTLGYDSNGNLTSITTPEGRTTTFTYDSENRLVSATDPAGNTSRIEYDAAGQRIATVDALERRTEFEYNDRGLLIKTIFADGTEEVNEYDILDRLIATTNPNGDTTEFEYNALDELIAVVDAANNRTTYGRDLVGNLISQTDALGRATTYTYDGVNRLLTTELPLGQTFTNTNDAVGNIVSTNDFNGDILNYDYDGLGQLLEISTSDDTVLEGFTYSPTGQIATINDERGLTTFSYDELDRLTQRTDPDNTFISYTYDGDDNITSLTTPSGTVGYSYDAVGFLDTLTERDGSVTDYDYDAVGNLTQTTFGNGVVETANYDVLNRVEELTTTDSDGDVLASYEYTFDNLGNRLSETDNTERVTNYEYNELNQVTEVAVIDANLGDETTSYEYDAAGNVISKTDSTGETTYTYDDNDRLITEESNGQVITYSYDDAGNLIDKSINGIIVEVYNWNIQGELASAEITRDGNTTNTEYEYNSDGIRVSETVDGVKSNFLIDNNQQEFAQVIEEYDSNLIQVVYTHGLDLISQVRGSDKGYYHTDSLGSARFLTNEAGNVINTYLYDAYGSILNQTEILENSYKYTGEQFDQNLENYYLRARYYNPASGRFVSRDSFDGFATRPLSLNDYLYGEGNPINAIDPSGEVSAVEYAILIGAISGAILAPTFDIICKASLDEFGDITVSRVISKSVVGATVGATVGGILAYAALNISVLSYFAPKFASNLFRKTQTLLKVPTVGIGILGTKIFLFENCDFVEFISSGF